MMVEQDETRYRVSGVPQEATKENFVGVAAWLPPGGFSLSPRRQLRVSPDTARILLAAAPRSIPPLMRFMAGVNELQPAQPYWYLEVVGVDPGARGLGIGTRLLEPVLDRADEAGQPCYLETRMERNVAWYRSLGFEPRAQVGDASEERST